MRKLNRNKRASRQLRQPSLYSRTEPVREKRTGNGIWYSLSLFLLVVALVYLVFISNIFFVSEVEFSPTEFVNRGELLEVLDDNQLFTNNNIITYGVFGLSNRLEKVTGVESISVKRVSSHKVLIKIDEKTPLLVWETLGRKYLVDEYGYVWADYEDKYASLPVVVDTKNLPIKIGDKVMPQGTVDFLKGLMTSFGETGTRATKYEIMDIVSDIKVTSDAGWYVYFDTSRSVTGELISLERVLAEVSRSKSSLEYVDLRIANRIFYK